MKISSTSFRPQWYGIPERNENKLWLDRNENINEEIFDFLRKKLKITKYSFSSYPNLSKLYSTLAKNFNLKEGNFLLTNGSDGGIKIIYESLLNSGDIIIRFDPTYAMYGVYSKLYKIKEKLINFKRLNTVVSIKEAEIFKKLKLPKVKMIVIANPNSPTGTILSNELLFKIIKFCQNKKILVLLDEAYFVYYNTPFIQYVNKFNNLIITRSFSKAFGLAGLRLGCVVSNFKLTSLLHNFRPMYEISTLSAEALSIIFSTKGLNIVKKNAISQINEKKLFIEAVNKLGYQTLISYANFFHINLGKNKKNIIKKLNKFCYFRCDEKHKSLQGFSRITITCKKNFDKILSVLKNEKN